MNLEKYLALPWGNIQTGFEADQAGNVTENSSENTFKEGLLGRHLMWPNLSCYRLSQCPEVLPVAKSLILRWSLILECLVWSAFVNSMAEPQM